MNFEGVLIDSVRRNGAVTSNSLYELKGELSEINRTLQVIGVQLIELNKNLKEKQE